LSNYQHVMKLKRLISFYIFLVGIPLFLIAQQNVEFENIGVKDGLLAAHTNQIIQDKKEFIWIATGNGLNRFDGLDFKVFQHNKENSQSLSGNNIRCVFEDSRGFVWAGTLNSGLNQYDYNTGKFKRFLHDENDESSISNNDILCVFEDSDGKLWIGTEGGLNLFDYKTETFTSFQFEADNAHTLSANAVLTIAEDSRGWLWVGTWSGGLNLVIPTDIPNEFHFRHFKIGETNFDLKSNHIWKLFLDTKNRLWVGTHSGGLSIMYSNEEINPEKFQPKFVSFFQEGIGNPIANNAIMGLDEDRFGQVWVATLNGLSIIKARITEKESEERYEITESRHYRNRFSEKSSLIHNEMQNVFIDKNGIVWCSTVSGVSKYDKRSARFNYFLPNVNEEQNFLTVALLEYNDDVIYIASRPELGLIEYNQKDNTYQSFLNSTNPDTEFLSFCKVDSTNIWIGERNGLVLFNPITKEFKNYPLLNPNGNILVNKNVRKILKQKDGNLWLATGSGLVSFDPQTEIFKFFEEDNLGNRLPNTDINDIAFDEEGNLWLALYGGLSRLEMNSDGRFTFATYVNDIDNPKSICSNRVINLAVLNGQVWAGTENGLVTYNSETDDFDNITGENGLKDPNIISILSGNDNRLWFATRQGLVAYNSRSSTLAYYNEQDGIQAGSFTVRTAYKSKNGPLYFGGTNGYIKFANIKSNPNIPTIRITDIKVFNNSDLWDKDVSVLRTITLKPNQNYLTVDFAALNFTQSADNQYAYMLEGFNSDWVYCGTQKSVSFSNLDGKTYTLRIKASNNDGKWNEEGIRLTIIVVLPIWKRTWFKLIIISSILLAIILSYINGVNQIKAQKIKLEKQVEIRTEEIRLKNRQIEGLVDELKTQNSELEEIIRGQT